MDSLKLSPNLEGAIKEVIKLNVSVLIAHGHFKGISMAFPSPSVIVKSL
jgi:hypothetical protein